jgi:RHS repeat-associated protein
VPDAAPPNGGLYAFCDDLLIDAAAAIRTSITGTAPDRTFTIEWYNALRYTDPTATDRINAAITLAENGTITFNYSGINSGDAEERGAAAVVGIENAAGTAGVLHSNRTAVLADNAAIVFTPTVVGGPTSTGGAGVPGTFTFGANGVGDVSAYQYGLNANPPDTTVNATAVGAGATTTITPTADGPQILYVRSQDRAGNQSATREYRFFAGPGGVTSPKPGDVTAAKFALTAVGHPASTGVTYQWRRADTDVWSNIPLANLTYAVGGTPVTTVPIITTGGGAYPNLNWDVEATLAAADTGLIARDGPLQVRAIFSGLTNGEAKPVKVTFDRAQAAAASANIGPGSVNLITGNYTVGQSDVSVAGLGVGRSFNTRQPGARDAMYGPGWASGVTVADASAPYTQLNVYGSLVQVGLPDDTIVGFTKKTTTGTGATFEAQPGAEDLNLVYTTSSDSYTLTDGEGNVVTFTRQTTDPAGQYMPTSATPPGTGNSTTYSWEKVTVDGQAVVRPTRVLAPVPAGVTCTTLVKGCRALTFTYATSTTATGTAEGAWGDYSGRIKEISYVAWDPDLTTPAMRTVVMARYAYDNTGRLRASWDPRLDWTDGSGTHHLWHRYTYDGDGILTTITPAGQEPWQLTHTTLPSDPGKGRLHKVSRSALSAGTAVDTVVYKIPTSGGGAPYDLSGGQTARWYQVEPPVDATAIFPGTQVPTGNPATGTLPSSYERATVTYMDANARAVNTVEPGGYTSTTWYDTHGNVVRELSAANRQRALEASATDSADQESAAARKLSTYSTYTVDGKRLIVTLGPEHDVVLPDGTIVRGRAFEELTYDQGAPPTGGPYDLVTTQVTAVYYLNSTGIAAIADQRTTTTEYDWTLQQPTAEIVDPAGLNLKTRTAYDAAGNVIATTTPAGGNIDTTPSTRKTVYYTTAANATYPECGNRAEWATLVCRTHPGGQPASGPELLVTVTTYDIYAQPRVQTEKNTAGTQRTITIAYDGAGRALETTVSGLGEPLEKRRNVYDPATGQLTRTQSVSGGGTVSAEVIRAYDTLGRMTSYTDADGNASTTTYDLVSRPATTNDGKATQTYTYDGGSERRGLVTQVVDSQAGTFTALYDAAGAVKTQNWPNGIVVAVDTEEAGAPSAVRYTYPACGQTDCTIYSETASVDAHDLWATRDSTFSRQELGYDKAGRLTSVADRLGDAECVTRTYTFSTASNRTGLTTYDADATGACQTTTSSSVANWTYDTADRLTTPGTVYDAIGRTTTMPSGDTVTGDTAITVAYYVNDAVRQVTQGSTQTTYTADVVGKRVRSTTVVGDTTAEKTFHYSGDTDSPIWTEEDGWYSRIVAGFSSVSGIYTGVAGHVEWKIANLHGDLVATILDPDDGVADVHEADEHGLSRAGPALGQRYGYLGAAQRAADNPGGLITMGARLYNPATSRFLSVDPVYGGSANPYEYATGDPVNKLDVSGELYCRRTSLSSRKWYWWWGGLGGFRVDWNWQCYISNSNAKTITRFGLAYAIIAGIAALVSAPTAAAFAVAAAVIAWFWWEYSESCTRRHGAYVTGYFRWWTNKNWKFQWGYGGIKNKFCAW